jgi:hypothetical protein
MHDVLGGGPSIGPSIVETYIPRITAKKRIGILVEGRRRQQWDLTHKVIPVGQDVLGSVWREWVKEVVQHRAVLMVRGLCLWVFSSIQIKVH